MPCALCGEAVPVGAENSGAWFYCSGVSVTNDDSRDTLPPARAGAVQRQRWGVYSCHEELGQGGSGVVYAATDTRDGTPAALKVIRSGAAATERERRRFATEIEAMARLDLPGTVTVLGTGETDEGLPWYAMKRVRGPSLAMLIDRSGALPAAEVLRIGAALAHTLATVHEADVAHRDIKPSNILMTEGGEPLIADFGVASFLTDSRSRLTQTGQLLGTPVYMAPELLSSPGTHPDWRLADQWSLGAVIFEMATGRRLRERLGETSRPPALEQPELVPLNPVLDAMLSLDPRARYTHTRLLASDLERLARGDTASPPRRGVLRRALHWLDQPGGMGRAAAGAGITAALALGLAGGGWLWSASADARAEAQAERLWAGTEQRLGELDQAGKVDEAARVFDVFASDPRVEGRGAASDGYAHRSGAALQRGDAGAAVQHAAAAWVAATDAAEGRAALVALALGLSAQDDLTRLAALMPHLPPTMPGHRDLRRRTALHGGDLATAATLTDPPGAAALLEEWAHALPAAPLPAGSRDISDFDGDGIVDRISYDGAHWLQLSSQDEPIAIPAPSGSLLHAAKGEPGWMFRPGEAPALYRFEGDRVRLVAEPDKRTNWIAAVAVQGRAFMLAAGDERNAFELDLTSGALTPIDPDLSARGSFVLDANAGDLDGDGDPELVLSVGPPQGFEVRVYDLVPGGVELVARKRLGFVPAVHVGQGPDGPLLFASVVHEHAGAGIFGDARPHGADAGLYTFALHEGQLQQRAFAPAPRDRWGGPTRVRFTNVLDLNGDRLDDVLFHPETDQGTSDVGVMVQAPDGALSTHLLGGMVLQSAQSVDADPTVELLVKRSGGDDVQLLGAGGEPPPPPPSTGLPPTDRAEMLEWLGLGAAAAAAHEVAASAGDPATARKHWLAAAELHAESGNPAAASLAAERAADRGDAVGPLLDALRYAEQARDHPRAAELAARLQARDDLPDHAAAEVRAKRDWLLRIAEPHPVDLALLARGARVPTVRHDAAAGTVELDVVNGDQALIEIPLKRVEGPLGAAVELDIDTVEWGSGVAVQLMPVDAQPGPGWMQAELIGRGLGSGYFAEAYCAPFALAAKVDYTDPRARIPARLELVSEPSGTELACFVELGDSAVLRHPGVAPVPDTASWKLVIRPANQSIRGALMRVAVRSLSLHGAVALEPRQPVVFDDPDEALLARLDRPGTAGQDTALRLLPARSLRRLRQGGADEAGARALVDAWAATIGSHPDSAEVSKLLDRVDVELDGPLGDSEGGLGLLLARATRSAAQGRVQPADRDWRRVAHNPLATPEQCMRAHEGLVRLARRRGDPTEATRLGEAGVACAPSELLARDRLEWME